MAGRQASLYDPFGDRRIQYEAALEFGTDMLNGQLMYARNPVSALYDRREKVERATRARVENQIPARSPHLE